MGNFLQTASLLTSLLSPEAGVELVKSSRSRLGVRLIFRVSTVSSLKNESVLRTVPFLDLLTVPSSILSEPLVISWRRELTLTFEGFFASSRFFVLGGSTQCTLL